MNISVKEDKQFDPYGNLVDYRVPKTIYDINEWLDGPISPIEVIEWDSSLYFAEELSQPENILIRKQLWEKVYEEYSSGKKVTLSPYKEQLFLRKYCFHPIESVELKRLFIPAYQDCVSNIDKLISIEGMSEIKVDAALGPNFDVEMAKQVQIMLERPSVENDVQIAKILRKLGYPIQAIFFLENHYGLDKDKMIPNTSLLAATIDLFTLDRINKESIGSNIEKHSPFQSVEKFINFFMMALSIDKTDTYIRKTYARWMLFDVDGRYSGDEVLELQKWIIKQTVDETDASRKMMAHQVILTLRLKNIGNYELKSELEKLAIDILSTLGDPDPEFSSMDFNFRTIVRVIKEEINHTKHTDAIKKILFYLNVLERHPKHRGYKGRHDMLISLKDECGEEN